MSKVGLSTLLPQDEAHRDHFIVTCYFFSVQFIKFIKERKGEAVAVLCWTATWVKSPACLSHAHT